MDGLLSASLLECLLLVPYSDSTLFVLTALEEIDL